MAKKRKKKRAAQPLPEVPGEPPSRLSQFVQGVLEGMREVEWLGGQKPWLADDEVEKDSMRLCGNCKQARRDHCLCGACVLVNGVKCPGFKER